MKPDVLLMEPMMPEIEAKLDAAYQVHRLFKADDTDAVISRVGKQVRGIVTGGGTGAKTALVDALPALEIIAINGIGTDAVDLEHARARSIRVTTTPDVLTDDVADLGLALLLATARRVCFSDRFVRAGRWGHAGPALSTKVSRKRLGIFGLGKIGQAIARRAEGFDMSIAYSNLHPVEGVTYRYEPTLERLAGASDFLMIAVSASPATRGIVNRAVLDALGPKGILINVARGSVVDEPALVAALTEGRLGGAGLDVFAHEPQVPEALWTMDNVVLQPHQASATVETRLAMANLEAQFAGRGPVTPVV
jgi:lactate dehydrogenase-like 2-hydroxyacid dehydrogenase